MTTSGRSRRVRAGIRGAFLGFAVALVALPALPAAAGVSNDIGPIGHIGDVGSPQPMSVALELLLFIGIPVLGFIISALLAFGPRRGPARRYRPGRAWTAEPVWFGDESAIESEPKRAALPGAGGASGRW